jgi:acylphosphatase
MNSSGAAVFILRIQGRVQGVGYRDAMVAAAQSLGITGWVRNRADGSVEALVQGDEKTIESIIEWAKRGPTFARVSSLTAKAAQVENLNTFERR